MDNDTKVFEIALKREAERYTLLNSIFEGPGGRDVKRVGVPSKWRGIKATRYIESEG